MTQINLLPWRELRREQEKKTFISHLAVAFVVSLLIVILMNYHVTRKIDEQSKFNKRLENEITEYKKQIADIKQLRTLRQSLIARMNIIQNLQATRILTVRLCDELINILPDGVFVTKMGRVGDKISISGYTESNSNISSLMRNIQLSDWIQQPQLTEIKNTKVEREETPSEFKLSFILKPKNAYSVWNGYSLI